jgi:hypothetical protein
MTRVGSASRTFAFSPTQLEALEAWSDLANVDLEDVETYLDNHDQLVAECEITGHEARFDYQGALVYDDRLGGTRV